MTDAGVAEIYAVVREALKSGQQSFQVQAFPFRMTPENMAMHKNDPNLTFWTTIKEGYDRFEATRQPPNVSYCGGRYVFDTSFDGYEPRDPLGPCPAELNVDGVSIASTFRTVDQTASDALPDGALSVHAYSDGSMHPIFQEILKTRGAETLAAKSSIERIPVSRPNAALADPHVPDQ